MCKITVQLKTKFIYVNIEDQVDFILMKLMLKLVGSIPQAYFCLLKCLKSIKPCFFIIYVEIFETRFYFGLFNPLGPVVKFGII